MTSFPSADPEPWPSPPPESTSGETPRFPDKGTWPPAGYRSAGTRTRVATVIHVLGALATLTSIIVIAQVFDLIDKLERFQLTIAEENAWVERFDATNNIDSWASLLAIISLMTWLSRSVDNTPSLGGGIARRGPRWAIGAWFIPIVNIVMPALIMRDLARRISPDGKGHNRLVLAWWLLYWAPVIVSFYVALLPVAGTDSIRTLYAWLMAMQAINAAGYVATIVVIRRLQRDAEYWHDRRQREWQAAADASSQARRAVVEAAAGPVPFDEARP